MSLFLAFVAAATVAGNPSSQAAAEKPAAEEKKICKRVEMTGTRVGGKRVCATQAQWDAMQREAQEAMQSVGKLNSGSSSN